MVDYTGEKLGNYRLMKLLGRGGFADVYLGEHIYLQTVAAIKVLRMQLTDAVLEEIPHRGTHCCSIEPRQHRVGDRIRH